MFDYIAEGRSDFRKGFKETDNPYYPGSEYSKLWLEGYKEMESKGT